MDIANEAKTTILMCDSPCSTDKGCIPELPHHTCPYELKDGACPDVVGSRDCQHELTFTGCPTELIYEITTGSNAEAKSIEVPNEIRLATCDKKIKGLSTYYTYINSFISALDTEDPTQVHRDIIRAARKNSLIPDIPEDRYKQKEDYLARELMEACKILKAKMSKNKERSAFIKQYERPVEIFAPESGRVPLHINIIDAPPSKENVKFFEENGLFVWDKAFLSLLKSTGEEGKKAERKTRKQRKKRYDLYKSENQSPISGWFNDSYKENGDPFHASPLLQLLISFIYKDKIEKPQSFGQKNVPALTKPIHSTLTIMHRSKVFRLDDQIKMQDDGVVVGELTTAAVDPLVFQTVFNGANKFRSVLAHKVVRYLATEAFNQQARGINPCNILDKPGGYAQLAADLSSTNQRDESDLKELLHAMAYFQMKTPHFSGNLIVLGHYRSPFSRNQHQAVKITLGPELSPYYACKTKSLLIPVLKEPQLVKGSQYYASQYSLQNEIMAEFSDQSVFFAEHEFIKITDQTWERKAEQCNLPSKMLKKVKACWTQDGDEGEMFLDEIEPEIYTLGPAYKKEMDFLIQQGLRRKENSQRRIKGIEKARGK